MKLFQVSVLILIVATTVSDAADPKKVQTQIQGILNDVQDILNNKLLPAVRQDIETLANKIPGLLTNAITAASDPMTLTVKLVNAVIKAVQPVVKMVKKQLPPILQSILDLLNKVLTLLKSVTETV